MRNILTALAGAALLLGSTAGAQPPIASYRQNGLPNYAPDAYQSGLTLMSKVKADIDRAKNNPDPYPGDHYRFATARGEMDRLQHTWQNGSYTRSQLNDAIFHLELVLDNNHISPNSRALLNGDLERLRDLRVRRFY